MQILETPRVQLISERVAQTAHGLTDTANVYFDTTTGLWELGDNTDIFKLTDARVIEVVDVDTFLIGYVGRVEYPLHGFTHGVYYLSDTGFNTQTVPVTGYAQITMIVQDDNSYILPTQVAVKV